MPSQPVRQLQLADPVKGICADCMSCSCSSPCVYAHQCATFECAVIAGVYCTSSCPTVPEGVPGRVFCWLQNNPPPELVPVQQMYNHRAIQLSLLVACMYTAVGVFNLGFLTNFLSHSVIGGFTSGAAISECGTDSL